MYMTKKIGVSLPDDLYEWATHEVEEGRAESMSGLVAHGLAAMQGHALLVELIEDLAADIGELSEEDQARYEAAMRAADEAYRRGHARGSGNAA